MYVMGNNNKPKKYNEFPRAGAPSEVEIVDVTSCTNDLYPTLVSGTGIRSIGTNQNVKITGGDTLSVPKIETNDIKTCINETVAGTSNVLLNDDSNNIVKNNNLSYNSETETLNVGNVSTNDINAADINATNVTADCVCATSMGFENVNANCASFTNLNVSNTLTADKINVNEIGATEFTGKIETCGICNKTSNIQNGWYCCCDYPGSSDYMIYEQQIGPIKIFNFCSQMLQCNLYNTMRTFFNLDYGVKVPVMTTSSGEDFTNVRYLCRYESGGCAKIGFLNDSGSSVLTVDWESTEKVSNCTQRLTLVGIGYFCYPE